MVEDPSCVCVGATIFPTDKGAFVNVNRKEAVIDLGISLRNYNDDVSEILNGSIEKRCYHIMISHYDVLPQCYTMVSWIDLSKILAN